VNLPKDEGGTGVADMITGAVGTVAQGVGDVIASVGNILFKAREGGARGAKAPHAIRAQLGAGHVLDARLRSGVGAAFGHDFSAVRMHTDSGAARLADKLNARAFTYGQDIAFGTGEYRPGTLIGDALIAHELAHVVQQSGGGSPPAPASFDATNEEAFENDADMAAIGAVASLWARTQEGMLTIAQNVVPTLRSGLRLRRCIAGCSTTETSPTPSATPSAAPDAGPPDASAPLAVPLMTQFPTAAERQKAVDTAAVAMGVPTSMLERDHMEYEGTTPSGGGNTWPPHYDKVVWEKLSGKLKEITPKLGWDNEKPFTRIYGESFNDGWPLLQSSVFHEFQHVKQFLKKPEMLFKPGSGHASEVEAYCQEIIKAQELKLHEEKEITGRRGKLGKDEQLSGPDYIEFVLWRRLREHWSKTGLQERTTLKPLVDRARAAAEEMVKPHTLSL
jgi:hypothetical protein